MSNLNHSLLTLDQLKNTCLKIISPITHKLRNGSLVTTEFAETILLYSHFTLTNVLYLPQFSVNLIDFLKLTHNLECQHFFYNSNCLIHNSYSMEMIGVTELRGEFYILKHPHVEVPHTHSCYTDTCIYQLFHC